MSFIIVGLTAFLFSALSFFSGFGLATTLLPAFAVLFSPEKAVAATAIVHAANSSLKAFVMRKHIDGFIFMRFGVPAMAAALIGAALFSTTPSLPPIMSYHLGPLSAQISVAKLLIALLMVIFALSELLPFSKTITFPKKYLVAGGLLSGFLGGLSGHQGAIRAAFMTRFALTPASYIGTIAAIGLAVDMGRLLIYLAWFLIIGPSVLYKTPEMLLIVTAVTTALLGVMVGKRLVIEASLEDIRHLVGILMLAIATCLALGLV